jgi:hypothetical protein
VQQLIGYFDTKRKLAIKLGVDPYSTNAVLQHELDGIAWASFAGGATFSLATLPIGGGAGAALTVTDVTSSFDEMLRDKSPTDLKIINRKTLLALGAGEKATEQFLNNNAFSPSAQTALVLNLKSLNGVANRGAFVRTAGETSSDESDVIFCVSNSGSHEQDPQGQAHRSPGDDWRLSDLHRERRNNHNSIAMGLRRVDLRRSRLHKRRAEIRR